MTARLYVGTYAKYNNGSIVGAWLNLEDYADKDAFLEACAKLHADEDDPELMFQDFEGFPKSMYHESSVDDAIWEWLEMDEDDRELLAVYRENVDQAGTLDEARDAFWGKHDSQRDWAESFLEETGTLDRIPEDLRSYFDFDAYARDSDVTFVRHDGDVWVFHS